MITRRGFDGSRAWISIVGDSWSYSIASENRSVTPFTFVPPIGRPSGSTTFTVSDRPGSSWRSSVADSALGSMSISARRW